MEDKIELEGIFENGYGFISKKVMQDKDLSIGSKGIYAYFCSFSGKGNNSFPSRKKICYDLGISNDTLGKYLKELQDKKYIEVCHEKNNGKFMNNVYKICMSLPCPKFSYTVNSYTEKSYTENVDTNNNIYNNNNTNNNNINNKEEEENIFEFVEKNYGRTIAPIEFEKIKQWQEYFSEDMIKYAFELSIIKNARNFSYVSTILRNWYTSQIKTLNQAKEYITNRNSNNINKQKEVKDVPNWFNQELESNEINKDEYNELESLLKSMGE